MPLVWRQPAEARLDALLPAPSRSLCCLGLGGAGSLREGIRCLPGKFVFIPHHHSLLRYHFEIGDAGYIFTGGNADRDYKFFFEAVRDISVPCLLATNRPRLLADLQVPANVRLVSASHSEFRQLMARARIVVMPMRATLLHAGARQSILNAMYMGKPVVLTDPEGGADYIAQGKTGLLVPYGNVSALRAAISRLWQAPGEARAIGERAREAAAPLTTERCNSEIWKLAMRLLTPGADPELGTPVIHNGDSQTPD